MGDGGRKVDMAGAEDMANDEMDGVLVMVGAEDEAVGVDLAGGVCEPSEKKSVGGAADIGFGSCVDDDRGGFLEGLGVSRDMLALPFLREGGRNEVDGPDRLVGSSSSAFPVSLASTGEPPPGRRLLSEVRNTSPGPPPPPSTRSSFFSITGTSCFGAGSILSSEDLPAPVLGATRGFFAGGPSSSSSSVGGREGRLMAIFLVRLGLDGAEILVELELEGSVREREDEAFGGGSASVDLEVGGGSFERSDDADVVGVDRDVVVVVSKLSSPLSTSLP